MTRALVEAEVDSGLANGAQSSTDPMGLVQFALSRGASVEQIEKLVALAEREQAKRAKRAFESAVAAFKQNPPAVLRNKLVEFDTSKGRTSYKHATLDNVCAQLDPALAKFGLSARWKTDQLDGGLIRVTCILSHVEGHSEETRLQCTADISGGKNAIQAVGSTVTYLERYTLLAACGIAVQNADDDGAASGRPDDVLTGQQCKELCDLMNEKRADFDKFCQFFKINDISELPQTKFNQAMSMVSQKKGAK